jgi:hypothetical protein
VSPRARRKPIDFERARAKLRAAGFVADSTRGVIERVTATVLPGLADPVCARSCQKCHYCLRAKYGPLYWLRGHE